MCVCWTWSLEERDRLREPCMGNEHTLHGSTREEPRASRGAWIYTRVNHRYKTYKFPMKSFRHDPRHRRDGVKTFHNSTLARKAGGVSLAFCSSARPRTSPPSQEASAVPRVMFGGRVLLQLAPPGRSVCVGLPQSPPRLCLGDAARAPPCRIRRARAISRPILRGATLSRAHRLT